MSGVLSVRPVLSYLCVVMHLCYCSILRYLTDALLFLLVLVVVFFFFSSRRRHTRCLSDWSSDVCSSDLLGHVRVRFVLCDCLVDPRLDGGPAMLALLVMHHRVHGEQVDEVVRVPGVMRSEERRVGKECRSGWAADDGRKRKMKVEQTQLL